MAELVRVDADVAERGVHLSVTLAAGCTTALVGPNGAGKSTLVDLVAGTLSPDRGTVAVGEQTLTAVGTRGRGVHVPAYRRRIATMGQRPGLFPHLSVVENVAFGPRARGVRAPAARRRALAELDAVGLADVAERRPGALSGGQAQRVALARALAIDPDVLLLDEPLAALDAAVAHGVRRLLRERLAGRTCALVTHAVLDVWSLADRVAVLQDGHVAAVGTPQDVLSRPPTAFVGELADLSVLRGQASGADTLTTPGGLVVTGLPVHDWEPGSAGLATIGPDAVALHPGVGAGSPRNQWPATVTEVAPAGPVVRVGLRLPDDSRLVAAITPESALRLGLDAGVTCVAAVKATQVHLYPDGRVGGPASHPATRLAR